MHIIFSHPCGGGFVLPPYSTGKGQDYSLDICPTAGADSRYVQYEQQFLLAAQQPLSTVFNQHVLSQLTKLED